MGDKRCVTASALVNKIASVKSRVRAYGFAGPVTAAEPASPYIIYSFLCTSLTLDIARIYARIHTLTYAHLPFNAARLSSTKYSSGGQTARENRFS